MTRHQLRQVPGQSHDPASPDVDSLRSCRGVRAGDPRDYNATRSGYGRIVMHPGWPVREPAL